MSFRPNYDNGKKTESKDGEEKKVKTFTRRNNYRKNMTEEEKSFMALSGVEDCPNAEGIIRYTLQDMLRLREKNTKMPTMEECDCIVGYDEVLEISKEHEAALAEKEQEVPKMTEFKTEVPNTLRVDPRVRTLRSIMSQFTMDNPEQFNDMIRNCLLEIVEEPEVLRSAIESIIVKCCTDELYCDSFTSVLHLVVDSMTEKHRSLFLACLLDTCQTLYEQPRPEFGDDADSAALYEHTRKGFFYLLGALFTNSLMCEDIVLFVLTQLSQDYPTHLDSVEYVLTLVGRIGSFMERETATKLTIDEIFHTLILWEQEKELPQEMHDAIEELRDLKDAKWVKAIEVDKNMEATVSADWEKSVAGKRRNRREVEDEEAVRQANQLSLYCKNLWYDFVQHFVVEDISDVLAKFDDDQRKVFVYSSIKALLTHSEVQQRRVGVLLQSLLSQEALSQEVFLAGMEMVLAEYAKQRKTHRHALNAFRNMYFPLIQGHLLSLTQICELWKNKDHFDGALAELVFTLVDTWRATNGDEAVNALKEEKLTYDQVFVGGCPIIIGDRLLAKYGMKIVDGVVCFA